MLLYEKLPGYRFPLSIIGHAVWPYHRYVLSFLARAAPMTTLGRYRDAEERCLVLLGAHAGLRSGEVCALEWSDVQLTEAGLKVRGRIVPKGGLLDDALRAWALRHGGLLAQGSVFGFADTSSVGRRLQAPPALWTRWRRVSALHRPAVELRPAAVALHP